MKKLKLDLDTLAVDSFHPTPVEDADGTVFGEQLWPTIWTCHRATCGTTCAATCFSCRFTCTQPTCGHFTCGPITCRETCGQQTCVTCGQHTCGFTCLLCGR